MLQTGRHYRRRRKYVIHGNNGNSLVEKSLTARGWECSDNPDSFHLKWSEIKTHIDYDNFQEGQQLVNHIPTSACITTKSGLLTSLRSYFGSPIFKGKCGEPPADLSEFFPETFKLGDCRERERLLSIIGEDELWICKPTNSNQGKGIFLMKGKNDLIEYVDKRKKLKKDKLARRIVQRYITNPLLLDGRKFDIRVYLLVASTRPFNVFFHTGYLRLTVGQYDNNSDDMNTHLTNQYMQKKHPNYKETMQDTVWTMQQLQDYLIKEGHLDRLGLGHDWVMKDLNERLKTLSLTVFKSAQSSLAPRIGYFDLFGLDFMLDDNLNTWLIEVNTNPALHTHCQVLDSILPAMIDETLGICIEIFDKKSSGQPIFPIESVKNFEFLLSTARDRPQSSINTRELPAIKKEQKSEKKETTFKASSAPVRRESKSDSKSVMLDDPATKKFLAARSLPVGEQLKLSLIEVTPNPKQSIL